MLWNCIGGHVFFLFPKAEGEPEGAENDESVSAMKNNPDRLIDLYRRHLNYLRLSVTDRCNLGCLYCMPREGGRKVSHEDILTYEEALRLSRIAIGLGVTKIRLTGGEPLVRKDLCQFIPRLTSLPGLKDVSLTTNGIFLRENLESIRAGGIKRLNVSLDTLKRERYEKITGFDGLKRVLEAIEQARDMGFHPIKINMVVMKDLNDDEILDFARLSLKYPYHVRFIEYMPFGTVKPNPPLRHVPSDIIKDRVKGIGELLTVPGAIYDGPAERLKFRGAPGELGFISALSHHFCHKCNRLRLTASGQLRPCLLNDGEVDLKGPMRQGASDSELARLFIAAALKKPQAHHLDPQNSSLLSSQMSSIGG
jgi:cyclic pyranopterin phosphate synthase